jgi:hypothetical protein
MGIASMALEDRGSGCSFFVTRFDRGGLDPVIGTSRLRCEVARRACRASFSSILVNALRASVSSSLARRRRFFARRAAFFASLRFRLAARDAVLAFSTNASAVVIRICASCNGPGFVCEIFNEFNFIIQVNAPCYFRGIIDQRLTFRYGTKVGSVRTGFVGKQGLTTRDGRTHHGNWARNNFGSVRTDSPGESC